MTITSFDKTYIENEYFAETGEKINYTNSLINHLKKDKNINITKLSDNLTRGIEKTDTDIDVAVIYHDNNHVILVEGGDIEFITEIANSIKILK